MKTHSNSYTKNIMISNKIKAISISTNTTPTPRKPLLYHHITINNQNIQNNPTLKYFINITSKPPYIPQPLNNPSLQASKNQYT